jgi:hypothetical protein
MRRIAGAGQSSTQQNVLTMVADSALVLASLLASVYLATQFVGKRSALQRNNPAYSADEALTQPLPVPLSSTERALLVAVDTRCGYCLQGLPFYRSLEGVDAGRTKLVVVGTESKEVLLRFAQEGNLRSYAVESVPDGYFKNGFTPLLVLVDSRGQVLSSWAGVLDELKQREVVLALRNGR